MKFLTSFFLFLFLTFISADDHFQVINFDSSSGLLYEDHGNVVFSDDRWNLVTFVDISKYESEVNSILKSHNILKKIGERFKQVEDKRMDFLVETMHDQYQVLFQMTTTSTDKVIHNVVGITSKEHAHKMNDLVNEFDKSGQRDKIYDGQVMVFKSAISSEEDLHGRFEHLDQLYKKNKVITENFHSEGDKIEHHQKDIEDHIRTVRLLSVELEKRFTGITDSLYMIQRNILHPEIIKSVDFLNELKKTIDTTPTTHRFPYVLSPENAHNILSLIESQTYVLNKKIIFEIKVPLVGSTVFNLYKIHPNPMLKDGKNFVYIQPTSTFIAMSHDKKTYALMDVTRYCRRLTNGMLMCRPEIQYFTDKRPICETELLRGEQKIPNTCHTRVTPNHLDIWHQVDKNIWFFVKFKPEELTITCFNHPPATVTIEKTGFLVLNEPCFAKGTVTNIRTLEKTEPFTFNPMTKANILDDTCCTAERVGDTLKGVDHSFERITNVDLDDLDIVSFKITDPHN